MSSPKPNLRRAYLGWWMSSGYKNKYTNKFYNCLLEYTNYLYRYLDYIDFDRNQWEDIVQEFCTDMFYKQIAYKKSDSSPVTDWYLYMFPILKRFAYNYDRKKEETISHDIVYQKPTYEQPILYSSMEENLYELDTDTDLTSLINDFMYEHNNFEEPYDGIVKHLCLNLALSGFHEKENLGFKKNQKVINRRIYGLTAALEYDMNKEVYGKYIHEY